MPPDLPGIGFDILEVDLDVKGDRILSDISKSGGTQIQSSLQGDIWIFQKKFDEFSNNRPCNARILFRLALRSVEHSAILLSVRGNMALLRESGTFTHGKLANAQFASLRLRLSATSIAILFVLEINGG